MRMIPVTFREMLPGTFVRGYQGFWRQDTRALLTQWEVWLVRLTSGLDPYKYRERGVTTLGRRGRLFRPA